MIFLFFRLVIGHGSCEIAWTKHLKKVHFVNMVCEWRVMCGEMNSKSSFPFSKVALNVCNQLLETKLELHTTVIYSTSHYVSCQLEHLLSVRHAEKIHHCPMRFLTTPFDMLLFRSLYSWLTAKALAIQSRIMLSSTPWYFTSVYRCLVCNWLICHVWWLPRILLPYRWAP